MRWTDIPLMLSGAILMTLASCAPAQVPSTSVAATPTTSAAGATKVPTSAPTALPKPSSTSTPAPINLKFGNIQSYSDAGVLLAMEKGFFKEQGINLEYVAFTNNDQMIAPMGTDELDIGALLVTPAVLNVKDRGIDLRLVADKGTSRPKYESYWIMLRKDLADSGQVKTPADLKGMKVAIMARGAMGHQTAELMLAKGGLSEKDVADGKYEILPPPSNAPAFGNKAIAASFLIDPFATALVQQGLAVKWFASSSLFPGNSIEAATVAYAPKLAKNTDLGRRWMVGYLKGVRYFFEALKTAQGKAEVAAAVAKYTPIKDPKMFEDMEPAYLDPNGALDSASLKFQYDWLVKEGAYTGKTTFQDLIDTSFADYAVQQLGRYQ